jgi:hypothetical protein
MTVFRKPPKETTNHNQIPVHRRHGLTSVPPQMVAEVGDVAGRGPANREGFAIGGVKPPGELLDVVRECTPRMLGQVVRGEELAEQGRLAFPDRNALENITTTILHLLFLQI